MDKLLNDAYLDPSSPSCFTSVREIKRQVPQAKRKEIENYLKTVRTYTLHRRIVNKFKRKKTISPGKFFSIQADLVDYSKYAAKNDGFKWILTVLDIYTRYLYTFPLKNKGGEEVSKAFRKLFKEYVPLSVYTDGGKEFKNTNVQSLFEEYNIRHIVPYSQLHCALLERWNRTLKTRIQKWMHSRGSTSYTKVLPQITRAINNTITRGIGMTPAEAVNLENKPVKIKKNRAKKCSLKVGTLVRITSHRAQFQKGYEQNATDEIFLVSKCIPGNPPVYNITALDGENIFGIFYAQELIETKNPGNVYLVEKILSKRKFKGKSQVLIKWKGYTHDHNSWEDETDVFSLDNDFSTSKNE